MKVFEEEVTQKAREEIASTINLMDESVSEEAVAPEVSSESLFIEYFKQKTLSRNLNYSDKDLINFHTAMKSSTLVILAGMSGTGKTKLFDSYAKALKLPESHYKIIPVRPAWTDDSDLIGYVDNMNMVYKPGSSELVDLLKRAQENPDEMFMVCFDEMNLAKVEHYFSQFLSILEMDLDERSLQLYHDELSNRLYNYKDYPSTLSIGSNVLFVGTVNIDESTHHFSDKVLDRANVIELDVQHFSELKNLADRRKDSSNMDERSFYEEYKNFRVKEKKIDLYEHEVNLLWELHLELRKISKNFGVGPRIVKQIDLFLKNLPDNKWVHRENAFDLQIVQRILTKVRGTEEQLLSFIGRYNKETDEVEGSIAISILEQFQQDESAFLETKKTIKEKAKELKHNGYTF